MSDHLACAVAGCAVPSGQPHTHLPPRLPRSTPRKVVVAARVDPSGRRYIRKRAKQEGVTPSVLVCRMLAYASAHMPEGWTSEPPTQTLED
jgi:hypothetical protein